MPLDSKEWSVKQLKEQLINTLRGYNGRSNMRWPDEPNGIPPAEKLMRRLRDPKYTKLLTFSEVSIIKQDPKLREILSDYPFSLLPDDYLKHSLTYDLQYASNGELDEIVADNEQQLSSEARLWLKVQGHNSYKGQPISFTYQDAEVLNKLPYKKVINKYPSKVLPEDFLAEKLQYELRQYSLANQDARKPVALSIADELPVLAKLVRTARGEDEYEGVKIRFSKEDLVLLEQDPDLMEIINKYPKSALPIQFQKDYLMYELQSFQEETPEIQKLITALDGRNTEISATDWDKITDNPEIMEILAQYPRSLLPTISEPVRENEFQPRHP